MWTADDPFSGVQSALYWSSTTLVVTPHFAWDVSMSNGLVFTADKTSNSGVWPVRAGQ